MLLLVISEQYHLKPSWVVQGERTVVMNIWGWMGKQITPGTVLGDDDYAGFKKRRSLRIFSRLPLINFY